MVVIIVLLKFMAYDFNRSIREKAILESSPDVGSCKYKCKVHIEISVLIASSSSKCSGGSAHMCRFARTFVANVFPGL